MKKKNNNFFKIEESILEKDKTDTEILVYSIIQYLIHRNEFLLTNIDILFKTSKMNYSREITHKEFKVFLNSLKDLESKGYIELKSSTEKGLNRKATIEIRLVKNDEIFVILNRKDLETILKSDCKQKAKLLRYYLYVLSTINAKTLRGFTSLEKLATECNLDIKTAYSYNVLLQELHLIYVHTHKPYINDLGSITRATNTYCRYEDEVKMKVVSSWVYKDKSKSEDKIKVKTTIKKVEINENYDEVNYANLDGLEWGDI